MPFLSVLKNSPLIRGLWQGIFVTGDNVRLAVQQPVLRRLLPGRAEWALDAGAGSGEYTRRLLLHRARRVVALDLNPSSLERLASRVTEAERGRCALAAASVGRLPCRDGRFDLVLLCEVLEHCEDDAGVLDELWRVLKPGGTMVIAVPVPPAAYPDRWHVREGYTYEALAALLEQHGFEVEAHEYCMFGWSRVMLRLRARTPVPLPLMLPVHLERWLMRGRGPDSIPFDVVVRARRRPTR